MTASSTTASSVAAEERLSAMLVSSQFAVATYLDTALQDLATGEEENEVESEELQRRMAELALQLQLQTQACHEEIGRIGAELQAILPRCATDIGRVGAGLEGIRLDASQLLDECAQLQNEEVSLSLETLSTLHALRSNLSRTQDILQAAATWDSTLQSIAALLAQPNLPAAVASLAQLEAGERALRGMPSGLEERRQALNDIRESVQALLQPQLQHALQTMHTRLAPLQQCVQLYQSLDKMDALQKEYVTNRPAILHKAWFAYRGGSGMNTGIPNASTNDPLTTWLPTWYDAVLKLLIEERGQSLAVFGPNLAPHMVSKVLAECFRPLIASFGTRLDSLSNEEANECSQLESLCSLYEATLQFLSLAYETVAGGWHDVADATTILGTEVYREIVEVFGKIASPFVPYQQSLAELERQHAYASQTLIKKDIQQAVGIIGAPTVTSLQDAAEKLKNLAPFVFPIAEAAMARLELLTGGHQVRLPIATIDSILNNHASELVVSIQTLGAAIATKLADCFNDMHVSSSLEILKVVGLYQASLSDFESKTRERMAVLQQRRVTYEMQAKEITLDSKSFLLPDALSVVEIDSILVKAALTDDGGNAGDDSPDSLSRLASSDSILFPEATDAIGRLRRCCHTFVFQVCSAVPHHHLKDMSSMESWTKSPSTVDYSLDSYGTLPQPYITQVGEHMLALVQALEPFASSTESLAMATQVMAGVKNVALQPWRNLFATIGVNDDTAIVQTLMKGTALHDFIEKTFDDDEEEDVEDETEKAQHDFCNKWLDVVGSAVTGQLLERILCIPRLSPKGCEHLAVDLNYLVNVLAALGVAGHPHPLVSHIAEISMNDETALQQLIQGRRAQISGGNNGTVLSTLCAIEERFAVMRGIKV